jgi:hypothetical protein
MGANFNQIWKAGVIAFGSLLFSTAVHATPLYVYGVVSNGRLIRTGGPVNAASVVCSYKQGGQALYRNCRISNGRVAGVSGGYSGRAKVRWYGRYMLCTIQNGRIKGEAWCLTPANGAGGVKKGY